MNPTFGYCLQPETFNLKPDQPPTFSHPVKDTRNPRNPRFPTKNQTDIKPDQTKKNSRNAALHAPRPVPRALFNSQPRTPSGSTDPTLNPQHAPPLPPSSPFSVKPPSTQINPNQAKSTLSAKKIPRAPTLQKPRIIGQIHKKWPKKPFKITQKSREF